MLTKQCWAGKPCQQGSTNATHTHSCRSLLRRSGLASWKRSCAASTGSPARSTSYTATKGQRSGGWCAKSECEAVSGSTAGSTHARWRRTPPPSPTRCSGVRPRARSRRRTPRPGRHKRQDRGIAARAERRAYMWPARAGYRVTLKEQSTVAHLEPVADGIDFADRWAVGHGCSERLWHVAT